MTAVLYIAIYCGLLTFVVGCVRRVRQYAKLPVHLRWELYPVPHESSQRARYGGSYFEESEWWTKPRSRNRVHELRVMGEEIVLLQTVRKSNRALWWRSLLFHSGLFTLVASIVCSALALLCTSLVPDVATFASTVGRVLGYAGLGCVLAGVVALLWRRTADESMRDYTHPADYLHLFVIGAAAVLLLAGSAGASAPSAWTVIRGAMLFDTALRVPAVLFAGMILCAALLAYIPFSRMAHFIGKYFAYHAVRWDDAPNAGVLSADLKRSLAYRPTWAATHISANGTKSWVDIALENPTAEVRK